MTPDDVARREHAALLAGKHLSEYLVPDGVRVSPLGAGWSSDIDLHVGRIPPADEVRALGWLPLDRLLGAIGSPGCGRWAIVDGDSVLAAADFHTTPLPDPVAAVLDRCLRRREVRLREVLELQELQRMGHRLPPAHAALPAISAIEADPCSAPLPLAHRRWAAPLGAARRALRPKLVVACSGVDGAGKSGLARALVDDLHRAGIPASLVWTRPGLRLGPLDKVARAVKHLLRANPEPGIRTVAKGDAETQLASRKGLVGWIWAMLITVAFLADVRWQHAKARGVVVYDRHLLDALATLDFAYEGVDLRAPRALTRWLLPKADVTLWLEVPADVAVARKPGDVIGDHAVRRQLESYESHAPLARNLCRLDATMPRDELAATAFRTVVGQ